MLWARLRASFQRRGKTWWAFPRTFHMLGNVGRCSFRLSSRIQQNKTDASFNSCWPPRDPGLRTLANRVKSSAYWRRCCTRCTKISTEHSCKSRRTRQLRNLYDSAENADCTYADSSDKLSTEKTSSPIVSHWGTACNHGLVLDDYDYA